MAFLPYLAGKALRRALEPGGHKLDPHRVPEHIQSIIADRNNKRLREAEIDPVDPNAKVKERGIVPFTGDNTQGEPKRLRFGDEDTNMTDAAGGEPTDSGQSTLALRSGSSGQASQGAHETPVLMREPMFRFKETCTTIIPTTFYFSANVLDYASTTKNKFEIRLNSPYYPIITPAAFVSQTPSSAPNEGISATAAPDSDTNYSTLGTFPFTVTTSHKPQWLSWWEQMYQAYHVMETHYEITIMSARTDNRNSVLVLWEEDQYGSSSTGNIMPDAGLDEMVEWAGTKQRLIRGLNDDNAPNFTKITGTWKPGRANRNTTNDGDVKTWNAIGAIPNPGYVESLHLRFFKGPMSSQNPANITGCNVQVKLSYVVQFKDLDVRFRYPRTGDTGLPVNLSAPTNTLKTA